MDMEEIESAMNLREEDISKDEESKDSADEDDDENHENLRCKNCSKQYRIKSRFLKHQSNCNGTTKVRNRGSTVKMTQHQVNTREVLTGLGLDDYFVSDGLPAALKLFREICDTPDNIVSLRGKRFENLKLQAEEVCKQLLNEEKNTSVKNFLKDVTQKLWKIIFGFDHLAQSSVRQSYIARNLKAYRLSQPLLDQWEEILKVCGINSNGKLLLQKIITAVYENINEFRSSSVRDALLIAEKYQDETVNKAVLTTSDESVVAYVAGYVCRKTKDKLQRYCSANRLSATCKVKENCTRLGEIVKTFGEHLPGLEKQTPSLSYPNLITHTLNRGGLTTVDPLTFKFFVVLKGAFDHIST